MMIIFWYINIEKIFYVNIRWYLDLNIVYILVYLKYGIFNEVNWRRIILRLKFVLFIYNKVIVLILRDLKGLFNII